MKLKNSVVVTRLGNSWVAYDGEEEMLYEFNEVGGKILSLIQEGVGKTSEIVKEIVKEFEVDKSQAEEDVREFLEKMEAEGLVK